MPRPAPGRKFRIFLGGTSNSTYELAGERGFAMVVPPLLPYEAMRTQLDIYRASCAKHGNQPDIVWNFMPVISMKIATLPSARQPT